MRYDNNPFEEMARRVQRDEPGAAERFRRRMLPPLQGLVRLALCKSAAFSRFDEHARAVANEIQECSDVEMSSHELARQAAELLCEEVIDCLQAGGRLQDTIVYAREERWAGGERTVLVS